jgi:Zn-finger nucleic acid-binding protein
MAAMTCPQCGSEMTGRDRGGATVAQCEGCGGLFLSAADRGLLTELENDWHRSSGGPITQPIPRISADMAAPAIMTQTTHAHSFIDELFG